MSKQAKRPRDINQLAKLIVDKATEEKNEKPVQFKKMVGSNKEGSK